MSIQDKNPWWIPVLTDAEWCAQIREDYPEDAANSDDDTIREEYADGWKYADTWDQLGDAREQLEKLADAYFELTAELAAAKRDAGRYRWLRNDCPQTICTELFGIEGAEDELDEAIDDAIEAEREGAAKYAAIDAATEQK